VFVWLCVRQNKESVLRVMQAVDRANGFAYSGSETDQTLLSFVRSSADAQFEYDRIGSIQEKFVGNETDETLPDVDMA